MNVGIDPGVGERGADVGRLAGEDRGLPPLRVAEEELHDVGTEREGLF